MTGATDTADSDRTTSGGSPIPDRATEKVSVRAIAAGDGTPDPSNRVRLKELAQDRGIENRRFALKELITSQETLVVPAASVSSETWENWLQDHETDAQRYRTGDPDVLRAVLVAAARQGKHVRAVGGGHSHSEVAKPQDDEWYVELSWYDEHTGTGQPEVRGLVGLEDDPWRGPFPIIQYKDFTKNPPQSDTATLVRAGAGNPLKYLNRKVLKDEGLALLNMGSYDAQTLAGAINTSTHGTGTEFGTLADVVHAVELLTVMESAAPDAPVVRKFRIEPTLGRTDREAFEDDVGTHGMTLIQDDEVFHAAVAGYGSMGIATAYTLAVRDKYFIRETKEVTTWENLENGYLRTLLDKDDVHQLQLLVNVGAVYADITPFGDEPWADATNIDFNPNVKCLVTKFERIPWEEKDTADNVDHNKKWPPERQGGGGLQRSIRKWLSGGGGLDPFTPNPLLAAAINFYFSQQTGPDFHGDNPSAATGRSASASYIALRRTADGEAKTPAKPPTDPPREAISMEIAVPLDSVEDAISDTLDWITQVSVDGSADIWNEISYDRGQTTGTVDNIRFPAPMGVRFTAPSEHALTPEYDENLEDGSDADPQPRAMIELPFNVMPIQPAAWKYEVLVKGLTLINPWAGIFAGIFAPALLPNQAITRDEMLKIARFAYPDIEQKLIDQHDGRPHMGKFSSVTESDLENMYPKYDTWHSVYREFNAFGTFNNGFTDRLGISVSRD